MSDPIDLLIERLTVEEEKVLVKQYTKTIVVLFGKFLSELLGPGNDVTAWVVKWSAATLFRRYYVHHTMADISPKEIMVGCMLLAAKIEECGAVTAARLFEWRERKYSLTQIIDAECAVAAGVTFDLHIFSPSTALSGLLEMLTSKCKEIVAASSKAPSSVPAGHLEIAQAALVSLEDKKLRIEMLKLVETLLNSDATFLFAPAMLALASASHGPLKEPIQKLLGMIADEKVTPFFSEPAVVSEEFKRIDAKLERVRNPLYNRESEEYKELQKQKESLYVKKQEVKLEQISKEKEETMKSLGVSSIDTTSKPPQPQEG